MEKEVIKDINGMIEVDRKVMERAILVAVKSRVMKLSRTMSLSEN